MELSIDVGAPPIPTARDARLSSVLDFMVDYRYTVSESERLGLRAVGQTHRMCGSSKGAKPE
jgi:hypothetical protein